MSVWIPSRRPSARRDRRSFRCLVAAVLASAAIVAAADAGGPGGDDDRGHPAPPGQPTAASDPSGHAEHRIVGRRSYLLHCAGCHGTEARGDGPDAMLMVPRPPDLRASDVFLRYDDAALAAFVRDGRPLRLELRPQAFRQHDHETAALDAFVRRIPALDWDAVEAGRDVYLDRCVPCHDAAGRPNDRLPPGVQRPPRDLSSSAFQDAVSTAALRTLVRHGKAAMPALVPRIDEAAADDLVAFVRVLSPGYTLYERHCRACHGERGQGAQGLAVDAGSARLAFDEDYFKKRAPEEIRREIWHMLRGAKPTMPHFSYVVTAADVRAIIGYLRSLP
jgi:mono/diheme cytochrome c family protein